MRPLRNYFHFYWSLLVVAKSNDSVVRLLSRKVVIATMNRFDAIQKVLSSMRWEMKTIAEQMSEWHCYVRRNTCWEIVLSFSEMRLHMKWENSVRHSLLDEICFNDVVPFMHFMHSQKERGSLVSIYSVMRRCAGHQALTWNGKTRKKCSLNEKWASRRCKKRNHEMTWE